MSWIDDLAYRLRALGRRSGKETELDEELRFHLEMEVERRMAAGESRAAASKAARLDFGAPEAIKEECRDAWGIRLVEETWRDLRSALRHLMKARAFSAVAISSLAIGLGAATVIFSLVDAVLLRPLPYREPGRLVALSEVTPEGQPFSSSEPNLIDFRRDSHTLDDVAAVLFPVPRPALLRDGVRARLAGMSVTPSFFTVLGVEARLGRTFLPDDGRRDAAARVAVLSDRAWRGYFAADPEIVGREIDLDGELWTVIGVLAADFRYGSGIDDIYLPHVLDPALPRGDHRLTVIARLRPGASVQAANDDLGSIARRLAEKYPESNKGWGVILEPLDRYLLGSQARQMHFVLLGAVGLLLLLACVNVSNLLLARAADRADEIRLRLALGAGRSRVLRQMLTESLLLGLLGALGAMMLARAAMPWVRGLDVSLPRLDQMTLDFRVLAFLSLVTVVSSLLFGLMPALRATRTESGAALRTRRQGSDAGSSRLRAGLVVAEVALATVLTVGAGLLLHSFEELSAFDSGFRTEGVLLARIDLPVERYSEGSEVTRHFFDRLLERVDVLPAVEAAGATMVSPFRGPATQNTVGVEDEVDRGAFTSIHWRGVSGDIFRALGIPVLRGRGFSSRGEPRLETVISASLAARLWPGRDPVGEKMRWRVPDGPLFEVIGVVGDVQDLEIGGELLPTVYLPQRIMGWPTLSLAVRAQGSLEPLAGAVRAAVREIDPLLAAPELSTLAGQRQEALARPLLSLRLIAISALIALLLAAVGVYGVVAYAVSRRRRELGVRVAIGARPEQLVTMVLSGAARLIGAGLLLGLAASLGLVGILRSLLYQTSPFDPQVLASVALLLAAVGGLASTLPAMRAARVDPVTVLRQD